MTIPVQTQRLLDDKGQVNPHWRRWLADLAGSAITLAQVQAIVDAAIAELGDSDVAILQSSTIQVTGTSGDGYTVALRPLADSGEGAALVKITRDGYGRVSGTEAAAAADLAYDNTTSGLASTEVQAAIDELADEKLDDAPSDGTGYVRKNGAWAAESVGGWSYGDPRAAIIDPAYDMLWNPPTSATGEPGASYPWTLQYQAGTFSVTSIDGGATAPGVWRLMAATTPTPASRVGVTQGTVANVAVGSGTVVIPFRFRVPTLSDASDTFAVAIGLADSFGTSTDRIYVDYSHGSNSGALRLITQKAGVTTITNGTGSAVAANTWKACRLEINAAGTQVDLYEGASLTATATANIPVASMLLGARISKSTGNNARHLDLDYLGPPQITFTTPR